MVAKSAERLADQKAESKVASWADKKAALTVVCSVAYWAIRSAVSKAGGMEP